MAEALQALAHVGARVPQRVVQVPEAPAHSLLEDPLRRAAARSSLAATAVRIESREQSSPARIAILASNLSINTEDVIILTGKDGRIRGIDRKKLSSLVAGSRRPSSPGRPGHAPAQRRRSGPRARAAGAGGFECALRAEGATGSSSRVRCRGG